jgi:hypothetical protein
MAKTSSVEKNEPPAQAGCTSIAAQACKRLKAIAIGPEALSAEERFAAQPEAGRAAAQFGADAHPQPLRADGPRSARLLSQGEDVHATSFARARPAKGLIPGLVKSSW